LNTIPSLVSGSAIPVNKHGVIGMSPVAGAVPTELCQETGDDTFAVNPTSNNKFGYRMDSGFGAIGSTITKIVFYFNNTTSATGNISAYVGTSSASTKIGTVDVTTIGSGQTAVTFDDNSHEVSEGDYFWVENDSGRSSNLAIYTIAGDPTTNPFDDTSVAFGAETTAGDPPPLDTGTLVITKVCITYS
jgi:hypothetical protein